MKKFFLATVLCAAFATHAETITLTGSACDANRNCYPVANDAGLPMTLYAGTTSPNVYLTFGGEMYVGQSTGGVINQVLYAADGTSVTAQVVFSHSTTRAPNGRITQHWAIVSGQVVR